MPPPLPRLTDFGDPQALAELKRRLYLTVAGVALTLAAAALMGGFTGDRPLLTAAAGAAVVLSLALMIAALRPAVQVSRLERAALPALLGVYALQLLADIAHSGATPTSPFTLVAIGLIAFIALPRTVATWLIGVTYLLSFAGPWILRGAWPGALPEPPYTLAWTQVLAGLSLLLTFGLAWYKDQLAREHTTARQLLQAASTDPLTKVHNRNRMYDLLGRELTAAAEGGRTFSVVLLDLDHFKRVNDRFGHNTGDQVLQRAAQLLQAGLRPDDHIGRWGGEEFLLLLPATPLHDADAAARRLWQLLRGAQFPRVGRLTASLGVATWGVGDSLETLVQRADDCLYHAKESGRDRVVSESDPHTAVLVNDRS